MKRIGSALILFLAAAGSAGAGTNFPALKDYPAPSCAKPEKLAPPAPVTVQVTPLGPSGSVKSVTGDVKDYNNRVALYNAALHAYSDCMRDYVANAQSDMDQIRDKANKAVLAGQESN